MDNKSGDGSRANQGYRRRRVAGGHGHGYHCWQELWGECHQL